MYAFPSINLTENAIAVAKEKRLEPDYFYCLEVLENTGLIIIPGSGKLNLKIKLIFLPPK